MKTNKTKEMNEKSKLIKVYTGTEITVNLLKDELEEEGITVSVHNEYELAANAGFSTGTPYSVDLFIQNTDLEKAEPIINEFIRINKP